MVGVNTEGTGARAFAGAEYVSGGKTGTAQVFSLKGGEYHLWLRNRQALYGVTNLVLAPGYEPEEKA